MPFNSSSTLLTLFLEMVNHLMDIGSVNIWFKSKMGFWIDRLGDIRLNPQVAKGRTRRICCCSSCYAYRKVCIFLGWINVGDRFRKKLSPSFFIKRSYKKIWNRIKFCPSDLVRIWGIDWEKIFFAILILAWIVKNFCFDHKHDRK